MNFTDLIRRKITGASKINIDCNDALLLELDFRDEVLIRICSWSEEVLELEIEKYQ